MSFLHTSRGPQGRSRIHGSFLGLLGNTSVLSQKTYRMWLQVGSLPKIIGRKWVDRWTRIPYWQTDILQCNFIGSLYCISILWAAYCTTFVTSTVKCSTTYIIFISIAENNFFITNLFGKSLCLFGGFHVYTYGRGNFIKVRVDTGYRK